MIPDYHIHTPYCGHAEGMIVDYIETAIQRGITEIGFSDHLGRYYLSRSQRKRHWDWGMDEYALARYYNEVSHLRDVYAGRVTIRIGLEVDYIYGAEDMLAPILRLYPLDFLLGSIHCLPRFGWRHLAKYATGDPVALFKEYLVCARQAMESGLFQSLAHLDFIWRYVSWPETGSDQIYESIESIIRAGVASGTCIEANMNGYMWSVMNDFASRRDPFELMVDSVVRQGGTLSLGSDAHSPDAVGKSFPEMIEYLKSRGVAEVATFSDKKKGIVALG